MLPSHLDSLLVKGALGHTLLAILCLAALAFSAQPILGVHPALKPLKFSLSIAVFLASLAFVLPALTTSPATRNVLAWLLVGTMVAEIIPIVLQPLRGTTSHFNVQGPFNTALWNLMLGAILVALGAMISVTILASFRPLLDAEGRAMDPLLALAWRASLWLFLLSAVSGFAMGQRMRHSVGGEDGDAGMPLTNWSVKFGDLRVSHFFALHGMQTLPLLAWGLRSMAMPEPLRWAILWVVIVAHFGLAVFSLAQAFAGRPFLARAV